MVLAANVSEYQTFTAWVSTITKLKDHNTRKHFCPAIQATLIATEWLFTKFNALVKILGVHFGKIMTKNFNKLGYFKRPNRGGGVKSKNRKFAKLS